MSVRTLASTFMQVRNLRRPVPASSPPPSPPPPSPAAPAVGGSMPAFSVQRASGGTNVPFSLGQVFSKGAVPSGNHIALSTAVYQTIPSSYWDDGSVKHAILAGLADDLDADTAYPVATSIGTAADSGGSDLTEANLNTALPGTGQNYVTFGSAGTVDLADLVETGALVQMEHVGPVYAAFQYVANFPSDSTMHAVFYVQLWKTSATPTYEYRVRVAVEVGNTESGEITERTKTGAITVEINNSVVFSDASFTQLEGQSWDQVGGSFTLPDVNHDGDYFISTKLVPNYGWRDINEDVLDALTDTGTPLGGVWQNQPWGHSYTPGEAHKMAENMADFGWHENIGIVNLFDTIYLCTGDSRARAAMHTSAREFRWYGVLYRDSTTKKLPLYSDWTSADIDSEYHDQRPRGGMRWAFSHHPNAGYVPWLLTGERFHLETLQAYAWMAYVTNNPSGGASRIWASQTRGRAWRLRTMAAVAAVSPDGDEFAEDCRVNIMANLDNWKDVHVDTDYPGTGLIGVYDDQDGGTGLQRSIFENLWIPTNLAWASDIEIGLTEAELDVLEEVRTFSFRAPVGLLGRGRAFNEYAWFRAPGPYRLTVGDGSDPSTDLYDTWWEVYQDTYSDSGSYDGTGGMLTSVSGSPNEDPTSGTDLTGVTGEADNSSDYSFAQNNWGHVLGAICAAVDYDYPGAIAAYLRLTGATNWASNSAKFANVPTYGVAPRVPTWYAQQSVNTWKNLGGLSFVDGIGPHPISYFDGDAEGVTEATTTSVFSYSGGFVNNVAFYDEDNVLHRGASIGLWGGGHNAYGGNEIYCYDIKNQTWHRIRDAYSTPVYRTSENADGTPNSRHTYQTIIHCPLTNELFSAATGARLSDDGSSGVFCHSFNFNDDDPNAAGPGPWTQNDDFIYPSSGFTPDITGICAVYDSDNHRVVTTNIGRYRISYFDVLTRAWSTEPSEASNSPISYSDQLAGCHIPGKNWLAVFGPASGGPSGGLRIADLNLTDPILEAKSVTGGPGATYVGITWDVANERLVVCTKGGSLYACTPPATTGGTWTFTALTNTGGDTLDNPPFPSTDEQGVGVWGRFGYVNDGVIHGYVLCGGPDHRIGFYKLG